MYPTIQKVYLIMLSKFCVMYLIAQNASNNRKFLQIMLYLISWKFLDIMLLQFLQNGYPRLQWTRWTQAIHTKNRLSLFRAWKVRLILVAIKKKQKCQVYHTEYSQCMWYWPKWTLSCKWFNSFCRMSMGEEPLQWSKRLQKVYRYVHCETGICQ